MKTKKRDKPQNSILFNPPISMNDDGSHIHVSVSLPGVVEEQIRIDLEKTTLTISVSENEKTHQTLILVPQGARIFKKRFFDGVMEIYLEKPEPRSSHRRR